MHSTLVVFSFITGLLIGSFLNVCIYRLPRKKSIVFPSSRCPACNAPIRPFDNIPVLSYLLLRGKCRECNTKISLRYPLVELLNGVFYALLLLRFGLHGYTIFYMVFISALIVITFIDLDYQIIPDVISLPGILIGLVMGIFVLIDPFSRHDPLGMMNSIIGLLSGGGLFYLIAILSKGGMGGGDIKMMGMLGAILGWKGVLATTFLGSFTGSIVGITLMIAQKKGRKSKIPFGPFLALGAFITLLWGQELLNFYLRR